MRDKMDEIALEDGDDSEVAGEVRAAWLGLIGLLAREVIRHLEQGDSPPGDQTMPNGPGSTGPGPRAKDHRSG